MLRRFLSIVYVFLLAITGTLSLPPGGSLASSQEAGLLAPTVQPGKYVVALEPVVDELTAPNWGVAAPNDPGRLFVTEQTGFVWAVNLQSETKNLFLDVSSRLVSLGIGGPGTFDERGLLGLAFHPEYAVNGLLYTLTSEPVAGPADFSTIPAGETANHQAVLLEWQVPNPADQASVVDPTSVREVLRVDEPQFNHNGGALNFGPDSYLYISLGDGGAGDDQGVGHGEGGNGQNPGTILGTILRIDPLGTNSANGRYGIPADNPFIGVDGMLDEIYAFGFRNPFRFSFDSQTGQLYVGDVGQNDIEEVDIVQSGGNYGWNVKEGSFCFNPNGDDRGFAYAAENCPGESPQLIDPIAEYNTSESLTENQDGRSVIGGFVYRGTRMPPLQGAYIFGDYSRFTADGVNNDGSLFYLSPESNSTSPRTIFSFSFTDRERLGLAVLGFGQDANGEIYVMGNETGTPFENTGVVLRIAPVQASLSTHKDNTLYEDTSGSTSNGAGEAFFAGKTQDGNIRRGLLSFDIAGAIPKGATITSAVLDLNMSRTISGDQQVALHRVQNSWGEGTSNASGFEGKGDDATAGDATWLHRFYDSDFWDSPGGDFANTSTATTIVGGVGGYSWGSNPIMVADVQSWLDDPASNYGWMVVGNEGSNTTAKRFDSKESPSPENRPSLVVEYLPPPPKSQIYLPMIRN